MKKIKECIKAFIKRLVLHSPNFALKLSRLIHGNYQISLNLDLLDPHQKRLLLCYITVTDMDFSKATHASVHHANQMIKIFIDMGFCIDVCLCNDDIAFERMRHRHYDIILGQGPLYTRFCKEMNIPLQILWITENTPAVVERKYAERIDDFHRRHPAVDYSMDVPRNGFLTDEMFRFSPIAIAMQSSYNLQEMGVYFKKLYAINGNAFFNADYQFQEEAVRQSVQTSKNRFLWFGSMGLIHKGVDVLVDAFREVPQCSIDFYGLSPRELPIFNKIKAENTVNCGRINVQGEAFIQEVVNRHSFMIFPSCSEGMSTAVATCMAHGIIPVVTRECGFAEHEAIMILDDWHVDSIKSKIIALNQMSDETVLNLRKAAYVYARQAFSLRHFEDSFKTIMKDIMKQNSTNRDSNITL